MMLILQNDWHDSTSECLCLCIINLYKVPSSSYNSITGFLSFRVFGFCRPVSDGNQTLISEIWSTRKEKCLMLSVGIIPCHKTPTTSNLRSIDILRHHVPVTVWTKLSWTEPQIAEGNDYPWHHRKWGDSSFDLAPVPGLYAGGPRIIRAVLEF